MKSNPIENGAIHYRKLNKNVFFFFISILIKKENELLFRPFVYCFMKYNCLKVKQT